MDDHFQKGSKVNEKQEKALREFDNARRKVQSQLTGKQGARAEIEYGEAYQRMVILGLVPQINMGYRTPKKYSGNNA